MNLDGEEARMRRLTATTLMLLLGLATAYATETQLTEAGAECRSPTWCSSGYIGFSSNRGGSFDIWAMPEAGEAVDSWRVTVNPANTDTDPAWNGPCTFLYFSGSTGGEYYIYYVRESGPPYSPILLSFESGNNYAPQATANGAVFYSDRAGNDDIMWIPGGGSAETYETYLTTNPYDDRYPCLSPGDSLVAFASNRSGNWDIWLMDVQGEAHGIWQLTNSPEDETYPAFNPAGDMVMFHRDGLGIAVVDVATRQVFEVTTNPSDTEPCWKPDGTMVAFVRNTGGEDQIWSSDNVPETAVERVTWGRCKALFR
jgi:Tol biopolymer transport system component